MYETFNIIPDKICNGITFNGNKCNKKCLNSNNNYCIIHHYMNEYTEDMLNNMKKCNKCFKYKFMENKTCIQCETNIFIKCKIQKNYINNITLMMLLVLYSYKHINIIIVR